MTISAQASQIRRLIVLDVGEGYAILLQHNSKGILIDTGNFAQSFELVRTIKKYGVTDLESVVLTHLHADHASGIFTIQESFPGARIYESGHRIPFDPSKDAYRWVAEALDSGRWDVQKIVRGDSVDWEGVSLNILWPKGPGKGSLNDQSLVIHMTSGKSNVLIMGDATIEAEKDLLQNELLPKNIDLLVVGHHGAVDASHQEFIDEISPRQAVIAINRNNVRGYPAPIIINRLKRSGATLHLTSRDGDCIFELQEQGL